MTDLRRLSIKANLLIRSCRVIVLAEGLEKRRENEAEMDNESI